MVYKTVDVDTTVTVDIDLDDFDEDDLIEHLEDNGYVIFNKNDPVNKYSCIDWSQVMHYMDLGLYQQAKEELWHKLCEAHGVDPDGIG